MEQTRTCVTADDQFTCGRRLSGAETYTLHAKEH